MLIIPEKEKERKRSETKKVITNQFNDQMEKILSKHSKVDKYWILGKVTFPDEFDGRVAKTFLDACLEKPPLVRNAFLYEVDNRKGAKSLLWIMHPNGDLQFPTLGKTVSVEQKGRNLSVAKK